MRKTASRSAALTLAAAAMGTLGALALTIAPAQAAPSNTAPAKSAPAKTTSLYAPSALVLTVTRGERADAAPERAVTLSCKPTATGTHPAASNACAQLRTAGGNFEKLKSEGDLYCTKEWRPVVVTAQGVWEGKRVNYQRTYANTCVKNVEGSSVFSF
ncbi:subtilase-type protease inhibitor [Streptomyces axinellae]|uniref:Probable subtilase-type protease inhibitor n=1 Tax=Streptomyces axinellae TaxID=552788 RepID=A0ABP6CHZ7_9ACTN